MTFAVIGALAVALGIAFPIAAHLLRRGRALEQEFPPAALVPATAPVARRRTRLEDRVLLGNRAIMVVLLAAVGATPLVRCSRLSLSRTSGASVALAIVVDDSMSMRARTRGGETRWDLAMAGTRDLLRSARGGDAIAIVLAGRPARLYLAATTDLAAARAAAAELKPSDRSTDIAGAVRLARSALERLPHVDKQVVLLSDLAGERVKDGGPGVWAPLEAARVPVDDCGVVSADRTKRRVSIVIACSSAAAATGRSVELRVPEGAGGSPASVASDARTRATTLHRTGPLATAPLVERAGVQTITMEIDAALASVDARLTGVDDLRHDDDAPVGPPTFRLSVAVVADSTSSVETGGTTIIEQALAALDLDAEVHPLAVLPASHNELDRYRVLILDDPPGIPADSRVAVREWIEGGGVAAAFLGPSAVRSKLGSTLQPFVRGGVGWERTEQAGLDPSSMTWLGPEAEGLGTIAPRGRVTLDRARPTNARIVARWPDGAAWALDRPVGRGVAMTFGLPSSVEQSDLALRPAFLALLQHAVDLAERRTGPRRSAAGFPWTFPGAKRVRIDGPGGPLAIEETAGPSESCPPGPDGSAGARCAPTSPAPRHKTATPVLHGRHVVEVDGERQSRIVTIESAEVTKSPMAQSSLVSTAGPGRGRALVDASPDIAFALLLFFVAELALRTFRRMPRRRVSDRRRGVTP